jgi:carboxymethylenebutenolidase
LQWIDIAGPDGSFRTCRAAHWQGSCHHPVAGNFGVNEHIRAVADQYAADGYVVLVPDLFWRAGAHIELAMTRPAGSAPWN